MVLDAVSIANTRNSEKGIKVGHQNDTFLDTLPPKALVLLDLKHEKEEGHMS